MLNGECFQDLEVCEIKFARVRSVLYRYSRYRYGCRAEVTEVSGTGIDVVPKLPNCPVPALMLYRTTEVSTTGMKVCIGGTGMVIVPNLPKCPVPVFMSYRTYTEDSGTGIDVVPVPVPCIDLGTYTRSIRTEHIISGIL